ncbi:MAG: 6,7-dimethyl-8-ribityllumazine synthase, partial [Planctomycetota bacterium]
HYDYVCEAAVGGLAAIGRETGKPATCGVLTCETLEQALQRAGGKGGNRGFEAALAALEMLWVARGILA